MTADASRNVPGERHAGPLALRPHAPVQSIGAEPPPVVTGLFVSFVMATKVRKSWQLLPRISDWIIGGRRVKAARSNQYCPHRPFQEDQPMLGTVLATLVIISLGSALGALAAWLERVLGITGQTGALRVLSGGPSGGRMDG
jgi:hypothetical protein